MERAFRIFDVDGNGTVSMSEFIDTMHKFAGQSSDEKLVFLFRVYDLDGKCNSHRARTEIRFFVELPQEWMGDIKLKLKVYGKQG